MEENKNKELESFVDSIMRKDSLESPSKDFTNKVIQHLEVLQEKKTIVYRPLISKQVWAILGVVLLVVLGYGFYRSDISGDSWLDTINWNVIVDNSLFNQIGKLNLSSSFIYAIVFLGLMLGIQIPLLKHHISKKLEF